MSFDNFGCTPKSPADMMTIKILSTGEETERRPIRICVTNFNVSTSKAICLLAVTCYIDVELQ